MLYYRAALVVVCSFVSLNSFSAEPKALQEGSSSFSFGLYRSGLQAVQYRRQLTNVSAMYFGLAYSKTETSFDPYVTDETETKGLLVGYRSYTGVAEVTSFVDMEFSYLESKSTVKGPGSNYYPSGRKAKQQGLGFYYGLEYFVASNFSIEGRAGILATSTKNNDGYNASRNNDSIVFPDTLIRISFYWQ